MPTTYIQPDNLFSSSKYGFSHVAVSQGSRVISVAGQTALDKNGNLVGKGDLEAQVGQVLKNIDIALQSAEATRNDIASMRIFIVGYKPEYGRVLSKALIGHYTADHLPASSWIGVETLANPDFLVEIEVTAIV